jgi:Domain of unknown function (DUF4158)
MFGAPFWGSTAAERSHSRDSVTPVTVIEPTISARWTGNKSVSLELAFGRKTPMPRQSILVAAERSALSAFPIEKSELIRLYTFSEQDLSVIKQRRGDANPLGFAVLLCALWYPGQALSAVSGRRIPSSNT